MRKLAWLGLAAPAALIAILAGCPSPFDPTTLLGDPPPDCASRPPAHVSVATSGQGYDVADTDAGLYVTSGFQGGQHIWVSVVPENLGPVVIVEPSVFDAEGKWLSPADLYSVFDLRDLDDGDGGTSPLVVQGRIGDDIDPTSIFGDTVTLKAKVIDACKHSASGQASGKVIGWNPNP